MQSASLQSASLQSASLQSASLQSASLQSASLQSACVAHRRQIQDQRSLGIPVVCVAEGWVRCFPIQRRLVKRTTSKWRARVKDDEIKTVYASSVPGNLNC